MYKKIIITAVFFGVLLFPVTQAQVTKNPIFPTYDAVNQMISDALASLPDLSDMVGSLISRVDVLEGLLADLTGKVDSNESDIAGLKEKTDQNELDINYLENRVKILEIPEAYFEYLEKQILIKDLASAEGIHVTSWLENYLARMDDEGWELYYVKHVPLGSGDLHKFKRHILYGLEPPSWEYLVEQIDWKSETDPFNYLEDYLLSKESEDWELLAINRVTWTSGPYWGTGDLFYFRR